MTCTKPGCGNRQCYICGKSCDYEHFSKSGCPLHDSVGNDVETRHRNEAQKAQEAARNRLLRENPDMTVEELRIKLPEDVNTGKKKPARPRAPRRRHGAPANPVPPLPRPPADDLAQFPAIYWNMHDQPAAQQQNQNRFFDELYRRHRNLAPGLPPQVENLQFLPVQGRRQNPDPAPPGQDAHEPPWQAVNNIPSHLAHKQVEPLREEVMAGLAAGVPLPRALALPHQALADASDDYWRTQLRELEQRNSALLEALRNPGGTLDRPQPLSGHAMRTSSRATAALQAPHDKKAPAPTAPPPVFDLTRDRQARNTPEPAVLGGEARRHSTEGNPAPGGRTVSPSPLTQTMEDMRQTKSLYSMEVRMSLAAALRPYIEEIAKQVGNHIQAAWVGPMPPHLVASMRDPIRKEVRKGVPDLVERELEEIDRVAGKVRWEKLYSAGGLHQLQHHGEIAPPETVDEYVALHAIVRSCDQRAPPHHEELALQAHAGVMKNMGKQQPPPRVTPFHHYGRPDQPPPQGQLETAQRIQKYLERKRARSLRHQAEGRIPETAMAGTGDGGKQGKPPAPPCLDLTNTGIRSAPQRRTSLLSLLGAARNEQGPASGPSQLTAGTGAWPSTPASSTGTGSKVTPILVDDADSDDEPKRLPTENMLPYKEAEARAVGPMSWYGEPPKKESV